MGRVDGLDVEVAPVVEVVSVGAVVDEEHAPAARSRAARSVERVKGLMSPSTGPGVRKLPNAKKRHPMSFFYRRSATRARAFSAMASIRADGTVKWLPIIENTTRSPDFVSR